MITFATLPAPRPMSAVLRNAQQRYLRGLAHALKPVVQIGGKGLSDSVLAELDIALEHHELIKVKVSAEDRDARDEMVAEMVMRSRANLIQRIGNVATLYRRSQDNPRIVLPR
jgi:RNA-binding protein